ncbi:hypothetical protein [Flavobacterium soyangense]|uniref:Uncharacterized protein n=1 Tax=Flavobacterium soyangense TaxID=2023265 RepID=A0A930U6F3_9FLAO|nr:hypothetical protein [Flavobacterium soyangense]MBF2707768.1 hypothetical protein [Flavobacterium soyangense]
MSLQSDEYKIKNEMFQKGLIEIDEKYIEYFEPRPRKFLSQKHDGIISHFTTNNLANGKIMINNIPDELPLEIKNDLLELFNRCWG